MLNLEIEKQNRKEAVFRVFGFPARFTDNRAKEKFYAILSLPQLQASPLFIGK